MRKRSLRGCLDCGFSDVGAAAAGFGPASYTEPIRTRRDAPLLAAGDLSKISLAPNWPPIHSAAAALPAWGDPWGGRCKPRGCSGGLRPTAGSCGKWGAHRTGGGTGGTRPRPRAAAASCPRCTAAQLCLAAPSPRRTQTSVCHGAADR